MDPAKLLIEELGSALLFALMIGVGLDLEADDFRRVAQQPALVAAGTLAQLALLPLVAVGIGRAVVLPPYVAAGMLLMAATPSGGFSNVVTYLARGNAALSVTLTAVTTLLSTLTLAPICHLGFALLLADRARVDVPVLSVIGRLALLVLLPVAIGIRTRSRRPDLARRVEPLLRRATLAALAIVALGGFLGERSHHGADLPAALEAGALFSGASLLLGLGVAAALRLAARDGVAFVASFAIRNVALSALLGIAAFGSLDLAVFSAGYLVTAFPLCGLAALLLRRLQGAPTGGPEAA